MIDLTEVTETVTVLSSKSKRKHPLLSIPVCLDTETSKHIEYDEKGNVTVCYGWIYLYGIEFGGAYATGRTPTEIIKDLENIRDSFGCSAEGTHLVVYIHNLSFDIQYLKDWLIKRYGDFDLLAIAPHRFIHFRCDAFEFRCSYKLSNRNLAKWANDLGVENRKAVGEINYNEKHYQDEELAPEQYHYMKQDVFTLKDCITEQMRVFGDTLKSIPLTSTGYVRRVVRKNFRKTLGNVSRFRKTRLTPTTYSLCRQEFAGGLTHGNRFYAGEIIKGNIRHRDFSSHYPTQQRARLWGFPKTRFQLYYDKDDDTEKMTIPQLLDLAKQNCMLVEIAIHKLEVKKGVTLPYAQASKFIAGKIAGNWERPIEDNGRLLYMGGTSIVVVNELDLTILYEQYNFDYEVLRVHTATRGSIPDYLAETVDFYFREKTRLKKKVRHLKDTGASADDIRAADKDLLIVKQMLNAIYGCTATNPVRCEIEMDTIGNWSEELLTPQTLEEKLDKFYSNYNSCMPYQLGCWTTSLARFQLYYVIAHVIGYQNFLYADTDSAFYISTPEVEKRLDEYNAKHRAAAERNGAFVEVDGEKTYYDSFDDEKEEITEFVFLHAKAYAYKTSDGKLHCTIAGVMDKNEVTKVTREQELGTLENFTSGTKFYDCGGTRCIYNEELPHTIIEDGHRIELASSAVLENVTKTLNMDYERSNIFYDDEYNIDILQ